MRTLVSGMDYPLLLFTVALFAIGWRVGNREYERVTRGPNPASMATFHKHPGWLRFALLALAFLFVGSMYFVFNRASLWNLPAWLDLSFLWWCNGIEAIFFGVLFGLGLAAWRREKLRDIRALVLTAVLCGMGLLVNVAINHRFAAPGLSEVLPSAQQLILQTSNYSCAAASGVNIASLFGFSVSEKQMAKWMGTRVAGTSPTGIIRGLGKTGIQGQKFSVPSREPSEVPVPSILLVDFPLLGPESHAIAALRFHPEGNNLEVWDPLTGRSFLSAGNLRSIWSSGHGIACER